MNSLADNPSSYFSVVNCLMEDLHREEKQAIAEASRLLADQIASDELIYVFGVGGHSVIGCEEFFWRAGGLCNISPLFDLSLNLSGGGIKSTKLERVPGIGDKVIQAADLSGRDVLIITSIYGMNSATIDAALEAKKRGVKIVAITSVDHARQTPLDFPARHPEKLNLFELADIFINNHVPHGDTVISVKGVGQLMGAVSTILVSACVQWLVMETAVRVAEKGLEVPVWQSANTVGGDEKNKKFLNHFSSRIKAL